MFLVATIWGRGSFIQKELSSKFYPHLSQAKSARDGKKISWNKDKQGNFNLHHRYLKNLNFDGFYLNKDNQRN